MPLGGLVVVLGPKLGNGHAEGRGNVLLYPARLAAPGDDDVDGRGAYVEFFGYVHTLEALKSHKTFDFAVHIFFIPRRKDNFILG